MKRNIRMFMAMLLFCTCILSFGLTQKANAAIDNTYGWGFGIYRVFNGDESQVNSNSQGNYVLNGNSVILLDAYVSTAYPGYCYVRVDGQYVGRSTDTGLDYLDQTQNNNVNVNGFIIKNLTPGKHTIEARADRPWNLGYNYGPAQKIDSVTVIVPGTTAK